MPDGILNNIFKNSSYFRIKFSLEEKQDKSAVLNFCFEIIAIDDTKVALPVNIGIYNLNGYSLIRYYSFG
jgi:hypothetical protein